MQDGHCNTRNAETPLQWLRARRPILHWIAPSEQLYPVGRAEGALSARLGRPGCWPDAWQQLVSRPGGLGARNTHWASRRPTTGERAGRLWKASKLNQFGARQICRQQSPAQWSGPSSRAARLDHLWSGADEQREAGGRRGESAAEWPVSVGERATRRGTRRATRRARRRREGKPHERSSRGASRVGELELETETESESDERAAVLLGPAGLCSVGERAAPD